jgi:putative hydrolase of the HAD superfamily
MSFRAVIFDLGGVVLDSPLHAIAAYERELGIPAGFVNRVVVETGPSGAWSRLERGELSRRAFEAAFEAECESKGHVLCAAAMMERIALCGPRPRMLAAIRSIRGSGRAVAALTNNWAHEGGGGSETDALRELFDVFVESSKLGLRKPDPRIYAHVCEALAIAPRDAVFLDDIGRNLKPARELGMRTIKVDEPDAALAELSGLLGFPLDAP